MNSQEFREKISQLRAAERELALGKVLELATSILNEVDEYQDILIWGEIPTDADWLCQVKLHSLGKFAVSFIGGRFSKEYTSLSDEEYEKYLNFPGDEEYCGGLLKISKARREEILKTLKSISYEFSSSIDDGCWTSIMGCDYNFIIIDRNKFTLGFNLLYEGQERLI